MSEVDQSESTSTELARERSREAASRTLMAWIRTSLSLLGFGFGLSRILHYLAQSHLVGAHDLDPTHSARIFGASFVLLGTFGLIAAIIQHWCTLRKIKQEDYKYTPSFPITELVALLLVLIGCYASIAVFW